MYFVWCMDDNEVCSNVSTQHSSVLRSVVPYTFFLKARILLMLQDDHANA